MKEGPEQQQFFRGPTSLCQQASSISSFLCSRFLRIGSLKLHFSGSNFSSTSVMIVRWDQCACSLRTSSYILITGLLLQALGTASIAVPSSNCYALDSSSQLIDFSNWTGHLFEYTGKDGDVAVHFCKDVETRSSTGYVDFGRFDKFNHFVAGSGHVDFVQRFYGGDLLNCETSYDKLGRTAQVNIICGKCPTVRCKDPLGCICNSTYESSCRISVYLAVPCKKQGPRLFQGFTVGFHPQSKEIVHNGITQSGYEKSQDDFSFMTEHTHLTLYMTAIASLSSSVKKPVVKVFPDEGLEVSLSGTAMERKHPTTLSPTMLILDWRCEKPRVSPYAVQVTIPVDGYESIEFTLSKMCAYKQEEKEDSVKGWAAFGILSCVCITLSTLLCLGGFIYKTRVENQHGLDALPGITYLSVCLETVSGDNNGGYSRPEDLNGGGDAFPNQSASWERPSTTILSNQTTYGSI